MYKSWYQDPQSQPGFKKTPICTKNRVPSMQHSSSFPNHMEILLHSTSSTVEVCNFDEQRYFTYVSSKTSIPAIHQQESCKD